MKEEEEEAHPSSSHIRGAVQVMMMGEWSGWSEEASEEEELVISREALISFVTAYAPLGAHGGDPHITIIYVCPGIHY